MAKIAKREKIGMTSISTELRWKDKRRNGHHFWTCSDECQRRFHQQGGLKIREGMSEALR